MGGPGREHGQFPSRCRIFNLTVVQKPSCPSLAFNGALVPEQGKILQPSLFMNEDGTVSMLCRSSSERFNKRYIDNNIVLLRGDKCV
jgi:hypothetical protein